MERQNAREQGARVVHEELRAELAYQELPPGAHLLDDTVPDRVVNAVVPDSARVHLGADQRPARGIDV